MKYIIQVVIAIALIVIIFSIPIQPEPEYNLKLKGLSSRVYADYAFTANGKYLIYKSSDGPNGREDNEYEAKVFNVESGEVLYSGKQIRNDILFDRIISVDENYYNLQTGRFIPSESKYALNNLSYLALNPDTTLYKVVRIYNSDEGYYFA